jgi:hypothetical protein
LQEKSNLVTVTSFEIKCLVYHLKKNTYAYYRPFTDTTKNSLEVRVRWLFEKNNIRHNTIELLGPSSPRPRMNPDILHHINQSGTQTN